MNGSIPALMRGEQAASIQDCGAMIWPGKRSTGASFRTFKIDTIEQEGTWKAFPSRSRSKMALV